jgi:hypothetical protein
MLRGQANQQHSPTPMVLMGAENDFGEYEKF